MSINAAWNVVNFRAGLVRALIADGHEVIAAVGDDGALAGIEALGARVVTLPMDSAGISPFADLRLLAHYRALFRHEQPDVYLGWTIKPNIYGSIAAAFAGVPAINNISGLGTAFLGAGWLMRVVGVLYRIGLRRSATVFFQNAADREVFVGRGLVRERQTALLPGSGIDGVAFDPAHYGQTTDGVFRFLLVARLIRDKGVFEFIEAARTIRVTHPAVRFQILGFLDVANRTAIDRATLEGWVAEGLIDYLGVADDVRPFLAQADCVVLPSYREGTSRVLLEAAAMARPTIATDVPGCRDVVRDRETGLLCRARDATDLARAMREMLASDDGARVAMGVAARRDVLARFAEHKVITSYRAVIGDALRGQVTSASQ
ncbi:glycosyltransferase family 4 protein [Sphingomonas sp. OK281]|uniref:glycosyltransferase family 4 protein n=1 Tax=Sphingomonas sp. OK281 TaxID=1881067 RepID=UPI0008EB2AB5|nr:glycosyltransferase family 4 protein [Sphingomonas sp. OK281]SFO48540.1 Glycosyltransferase involved in cell wall bisynthesis [Sphingomonas sp. OK281]